MSTADLDLKFKECATCAAKPGSPVLCDSCLHNRRVVDYLSKTIIDLGSRNEELRAAILKISRENPYPDEIKNWTEQRGKLLAEIGTLKAQVAEAETVSRVIRGDLVHLRAEHKRVVDACGEKNARIGALSDELKDRTEANLKLRVEKDGAYRERNRLVAALARIAKIKMLENKRGWGAGVGRHQPDPDPNWDPDWLTVIFIDTPEGQLSWHVADSDLALFDGIGRYLGVWDGHTTEVKYERLARLFR